MAALMQVCSECPLVADIAYKSTYASRKHGHGCERLCNDIESIWTTGFGNRPVRILMSGSPRTTITAIVFVPRAASAS